MTMDILSMQFFAALGSIVLLDVLLGGDNAVVIAMAANKLPAELRKKAVLIGTAGAVIIRLVMTMLAVWLMTIPFLQVLGGLILLPIAVKLLQQEDVLDNVEASDSLFGAVRTIIIADAAMGVENVLAVAGASHGSFLLVACGFVISIPIIVGGSTIVGKLIDRYPVILYASAGLLGWTAGSMIGHDKILGTLLQQMAGSWAPISLQILLAAAVIAIGLWMSRKRVVQ
ncbi:MAG: TerC family protein [Megasphaera elsdenii]|nr:TerC family protein [Megasphaera elsdenii]